MISTVTLEFEHGKTTCASEPGKFCIFLRSKSFGLKYHCYLFEERIFEGEDGWLQRCPQCIKHTEEQENENQ